MTAIGGVTPEKRIPEVIRAFGAIAERHPRLYLMLVGSTAAHYDVLADAQSRLTGWYESLGFVVVGDEYVEDDILHVPMRRQAR